MDILLAYMSVYPCMPRICDNEKRTLGLLELELQTVTSHHVSAGS